MHDIPTLCQTCVFGWLVGFKGGCIASVFSPNPKAFYSTQQITDGIFAYVSRLPICVAVRQ